MRITLSANRLTHKFHHKTAVHDVQVSIEPGKIYSIIGPNGCGKSTLLKMLARQLKPKSGEVLLDGNNLYRMAPAQAAKVMALLAQNNDKVDLTVEQLISYGRSPHKSLLEKMNENDQRIIEWAMEQTHVRHLIGRNVATLSGGERQRVWIAMAIAQQPSMLFLDEPTTYLDVSHQLEVLETIKELNRKHGVTIVMVLHDMTHAAACSDEIIVMHEGKIYNSGVPTEIMTANMFRQVFQVEARMYTDPEDGKTVYVLKGLANKRMQGDLPDE